MANVGASTRLHGLDGVGLLFDQLGPPMGLPEGGGDFFGGDGTAIDSVDTPEDGQLAEAGLKGQVLLDAFGSGEDFVLEVHAL